jgi:ATP-dependent Lon protease
LNIEKIYSRGEFKTNKKNKIDLTIDKITEILKEPEIHSKYIHKESSIGIINGLYATVNGTGGITPIQIYPNIQHSTDKYEIKLTGKQGEVMKESVLTSLTTAIEWLKSEDRGYGYNVEELMKMIILTVKKIRTILIQKKTKTKKKTIKVVKMI